MTRWAVTGGTGLVGRFIVEDLLARGQDVVVQGRTRPPAGFFSKPVAIRPVHLDQADNADFQGCSGLVHCAYDHLPGRYRGGEGDDPDRFWQRNVTGSLALFKRAKAAGVRRAIFLSSRAVYDGLPTSATMNEGQVPCPNTLYGQAKLAVEQGLTSLTAPGFETCCLRATGVYGPAGPGQRHKWTDLFTAHLAGQPISPRAGTEVHGADLADALWRAAHRPGAGLWNVSDLMLDRRDLLAEVNRITGRDLPLPATSDPDTVAPMDCSALRAVGWRPRGWDRLVGCLPQMLAQI